MNTALISGLNNPTGIAVSGPDLFVADTHGGGNNAGTDKLETKGRQVELSFISVCRSAGFEPFSCPGTMR